MCMQHGWKKRQSAAIDTMLFKNNYHSEGNPYSFRVRQEQHQYQRPDGYCRIKID